jgi:hypothetical protein
MIEMSADTAALKALGRALGEEADGKKLRRDLAKEMRAALAPAVAEAQSGIKSMPSRGLPHTGPPLRAAIARQIKAEARLSGRSTGARVKARKKSMPRGFANAPKRTNSQKGWRRQIFGRGVWVEQRGRPGWFDDPMQRNATQYRAAVLDAMEATAKRIAGKV